MYIHVSSKGVYNMKKNDQLPVEKGTASKIYGLAYYEPRSGYGIARVIGSQTHHVNSKIKELYKYGYLLKIEKKEWRWPRWQSNANILVKKIEQIKQKENITFTKLDKHVLYERLNNSLFRELAYGDFCVELKENQNPNAIDSILSQFEIISILMEQFSWFIEDCNRIHTEEDYQNAIQQDRNILEKLYVVLKFKELSDSTKIEDIPKLHIQFEKKLRKKIEFSKFNETITYFKESKQLIKADTKIFEKLEKQYGSKEKLYDLLLSFFIVPMPKHLFENYKGISSWGRKYKELEDLINILQELKFIDAIQSLNK